MARFDSSGTSTLVAFVSSHPLWEGRPVTISGITDDMGNTWKPLTGPTPWTGEIFTLLSAIYYVNAPATGAARDHGSLDQSSVAGDSRFRRIGFRCHGGSDLLCHHPSELEPDHGRRDERSHCRTE